MTEANLYTEDQMRQKWCPHSRHMWGSEEAYCIASECSQWLWGETPDFKAKAHTAYKRDGTRLKSATGYCGLTRERDK